MLINNFKNMSGFVSLNDSDLCIKSHKVQDAIQYTIGSGTPSPWRCQTREGSLCGLLEYLVILKPSIN